MKEVAEIKALEEELERLYDTDFPSTTIAMDFYVGRVREIHNKIRELKIED